MSKFISRESEAQEFCRCSEPPYRPPCSYCECNMGDEFYENRYWHILEKYEELRDSLTSQAYDEAYDTFRKKAELDAKVDTYESVREDLVKEVYAKEYQNILAQVRADVYDKLRIEIRESILKEFAEANDRI